MGTTTSRPLAGLYKMMLIRLRKENDLAIRELKAELRKARKITEDIKRRFAEEYETDAPKSEFSSNEKTKAPKPIVRQNLRVKYVSEKFQPCKYYSNPAKPCYIFHHKIRE